MSYKTSKIYDISLKVTNIFTNKNHTFTSNNLDESNLVIDDSIYICK